MKNLLLGLSLSLLSLSAFASTPTVKDINLGSFEGRSIVHECRLDLEENAEGKFVATFSKGDVVFKSVPLASDIDVMVSSNQQVWVDLRIEGMTHALVIFKSESDLTPQSFIVIEGRDNTLLKCKNLK